MKPFFIIREEPTDAMYLKSIEVQGFKSFARKMRFEFHNGITGIVGPNGSGKSNVADAVRWVLGEQSARQLRGGNMQDVIFAGTELRKPLSFASVAITLDNSDHALDIDYEEVTVMRRLYRSGESEYLLNGSNVRLRDINELFYDTGIGKEGYSIIGQGRIDQIISGKAEERRELFDEAAGIVKFKRRKAAALRKLDSEQQNMLRVSDILRELSGRVEPLRKQSETAKQYLDLRGRLRALDVNSFLQDAGTVDGQIEELTRKYELAVSQMQERQEEFERTKTEYDEIEQGLETIGAQIGVLRHADEENRLTLEQLRGHLSVLEARREAIEADKERSGQRAAQIAQQISERAEALEKSRNEREELASRLAEVRKDKEEKEAALAEADQTIAELGKKAEETKSEIISILNRRVSVRGKLQRYDTLREQIDIRSAQIMRREIELAEQGRTLSERLDRCAEEEKTLSEKADALAFAVKESEDRSSSLRLQIGKDSTDLDKTSEEYHREHSRLESLRAVTERYEGYGNAIQTIMTKKAGHRGIYGTVADLIRVDRKYETAIETALGGSIRNIVTDDQETARELIEFLKSEKAGRATFLPLDAITLKDKKPDEDILREKGVIGIASDLVDVEARFAVIPKYLLGRVYVVDTVDHAIRIGNRYDHSIYMVTLEGEWFTPGGSITGGSFRAKDNLLGRRRQIAELEEKTKLLKGRIETLRLAVISAREERDVLRERISQDNADLQKVNLRLAAVRLELRQTKEAGGQVGGTMEQLRREKEELASQIREVESERGGVSEELRTSQDREKELDDAGTQLAAQISEAEKVKEERSSLVETVHLKEAELAQQDRYLSETILRIGGEIRALEEESRELEGGAEENAKALTANFAEQKTASERILQIEKESEKNSEKENELSEKQRQMREGHKDFFARRDALSEEIAKLDKESFRLGAQRERLNESFDALRAYLWEEYELTPSEAKKEKNEELFAKSGLKKEAASVRSAIRALGSVNVNAIEEYKETQERYEFLKGQYDDLVSSEKSLQKIIAQLDTGMRRQFAERFEDIRREFNLVFKELFGGGAGTLQLEEDADVLEAGIAIIAQPPGKKLQNMMQLSGGEKSLTAIALLFAIQNLKPSPFCLLDEIEASLDEANVARFTGYLHKLTANTQFIVITHRRGTMAAADRLYGITMQEKGVSALVSVNLVKESLDE